MPAATYNAPPAGPHGEFDETKHPRGGPKNKGQFASKGGEEESAAGQKPQAPSPRKLRMQAAAAVESIGKPGQNPAETIAAGRAARDAIRQARAATAGKEKFVGETVGKAEHVRAAGIEREVASAVGGKALDDNEPLDVRIGAKGGGHAVEVKSLLKGGKQSISVHDDALLRKVNYSRENPGETFHTVAVDERASYEGGAHAENYSGNRLYYKRGSGRYSLSKMHPVKDAAELRQLIRTPDAELPEAARGSLPKGEAAKKLKAAAEKAHASRLAKDRARKARIKARIKAAKLAAKTA